MPEDALNTGVSSRSVALKNNHQRNSKWLLTIALVGSLLLHLGLLFSSMDWRVIGVDRTAKSPDGAVMIATLNRKVAPAVLPASPTKAPTNATATAKPAATKPKIRPPVITPAQPIDTNAANATTDSSLQPLPTIGAAPEVLPIAPALLKPVESQLAESTKPAVPTPTQIEAAPVVARGETNYTPRLDAMPGTIDIAYKVTSSVVDGIARYQFSRDKNNKYEIESSMEATGFFATMFEGRMQQTSRGSIAEEGLVPEFFSIRRGNGPGETATFDYAGNKLISKRRKGVEIENLPFQLQDIQSFLFQMGFDAPGLSAGLDGGMSQLNVVATNARKVYRYKFKWVGEESLNLPFGKIQTIHLKSDAVDPTDVYEVWLAKEYNHLPVKVKFFAGKFALEQTAQSITVTPFKG